MLFLLYLQTSDTATVFSPNGNKDAMIYLLIMCCMMLYIVMLVLLFTQHVAVCVDKNNFLGVMLFNLCGQIFYFACVL